MKFIHVADVHLGAEPDVGRVQRKNRASEIWDTFQKVIERCEKEQIDLLLIAGDLFHRQPLLRELKEVDSLFASLTRTKVVLVAGNHDYIKKNSYYKTFKWSKNVRMLGENDMQVVSLRGLDTAVYGLSYHTREWSEPVYENVKLTDSCKYHILLAHGGDEKHLPFRKNIVEQSGFDYVALGHIHKPQALVPGRMIYAGALEPIDKNDIGKHGYIKGELTEKGCVTKFVPFAKREYVHLEVEVEEDMTGYQLREKISDAILEKGQEHIYKIILEGFKDPEMQYDLSAMDSYGNVVEIVDHTKPAYDFYHLMQKNKDNLLGAYIASFGDAAPDSMEYEALCEGVQALMQTKRGQA